MYLKNLAYAPHLDHSLYSVQSEAKLEAVYPSNMSMETYAVVVFGERSEEEVALVPTRWLANNGKECWWPPYKSGPKVSKAVNP